MAFIFGGSTGDTAESLRRKRSVAEALMQQQQQPTDMWSGLNYAGSKIAGALLARQTGKKEDAKRAEATSEYDALVSAMMGGPKQTHTASDYAQPAQQAPRAVGSDIYSAIETVESGGNPNAVSPKGATGVMQIMPATARDPGFGVPNIFDQARGAGIEVPDESDATLEALLRNADLNRQFGRTYYDAMAQRFGGDQTKALAAYNAGPGEVDQYGGVPPFAETQAYVQKVGGLVGQQQPAMQAPQPPAQTQQMDPSQLMRLASNEFLNDNQRSVVSALLARQMQPPESMTPYQQAQLDMRRQEMEMRRRGEWSPGTSVTVNGPQAPDPMREAEAKGREEGIKALAKGAVDTFNEGRNAAQQLAQIDQLEGLLARTETGTVPAWQQWATETLGVQITGGPAQAASAIINSLIPSQRPPGSGSSSDRDVSMFRASLPQLVNTPEGNAEIITGMRAIAGYRQQISEIAGNALSGEITYSEMTKRMRDADAQLSEMLRSRREAMPQMYGKPETPDALRKRLGELGDL